MHFSPSRIALALIACGSSAAPVSNVGSLASPITSGGGIEAQYTPSDHHLEGNLPKRLVPLGLANGTRVPPSEDRNRTFPHFALPLRSINGTHVPSGDRNKTFPHHVEHLRPENGTDVLPSEDRNKKFPHHVASVQSNGTNVPLSKRRNETFSHHAVPILPKKRLQPLEAGTEGQELKNLLDNLRKRLEPLEVDTEGQGLTYGVIDNLIQRDSVSSSGLALPSGVHLGPGPVIGGSVTFPNGTTETVF